MRACVRARVRACVRACVCVCVCELALISNGNAVASHLHSVPPPLKVGTPGASADVCTLLPQISALYLIALYLLSCAFAYSFCSFLSPPHFPRPTFPLPLPVPPTTTTPHHPPPHTHTRPLLAHSSACFPKKCLQFQKIGIFLKIFFLIFFF